MPYHDMTMYCLALTGEVTWQLCDTMQTNMNIWRDKVLQGILRQHSATGEERVEVMDSGCADPNRWNY